MWGATTNPHWGNTHQFHALGNTVNFKIIFRQNSLLTIDFNTFIHFKIGFVQTICLWLYNFNQQVSSKFSHLKSTNTLMLHFTRAKVKRNFHILKLVFYQLLSLPLFTYLFVLHLIFVYECLETALHALALLRKHPLIMWRLALLDTTR